MIKGPKLVYLANELIYMSPKQESLKSVRFKKKRFNYGL